MPAAGRGRRLAVIALVLPCAAAAQHYPYANSTEVGVSGYAPEPYHGARPSIAGSGLHEGDWIEATARAVGSAGQPDEQACALITDDIAGRVAVVRRGGCTTGQKATNAQAAGAVALVVFNDVAPAAPEDTLLYWRDGPDSLVASIPVAMTRAWTGSLLRTLGDPAVRLRGSGGCYDYGGTTDPTPPWSYYPLSVGNVWEYKRWGMPGIEHYRERLDVVRDSIIGPVRYFVVQVARYDYAVPGPPSSVMHRLLRFDTTAARVVARGADGVEVAVTMPLDALNGIALITDGGTTWQVRLQGPNKVYHSCYDGLADVSGYGMEYRAGRGLTLNVEWPPFTAFFDAYELVYSLVNGVNWGTPWVWPVAAADAPERAAPWLRLMPVPSDRSAMARFSIPVAASVRLDVVDVLGRRVAIHDLGRRPAGAGEVALDVAGLRAGRYVVRLLGERDVRLTAPLVIAR